MSPPAAPFVITGATGAIGGVACRVLAERGLDQVLLVRTPQQATELTARLQRAAPAAKVETVVCDLSRPGSVITAATAIRAAHPAIRGLILSAAQYSATRKVTPEGLEVMFATNHLGPFLLTRELLPSLRNGAPSRVIAVSAPSTTRLDFDDLQSTRRFSGLRAFGATKAANLLFAYALAQRLGGTSVTSNVFFPGIVKSGLMRESPAVVRAIVRLVAKSPESAGAALAGMALDRSLDGVTGRFYKLSRPSDSSAYSHDVQNQQRLWQATERWIAEWENRVGAARPPG